MVLAVMLGAPIVPQLAHSMPVGRTWTAIETTRVTGYTELLPQHLSTNDRGAPVAFAQARGGIGKDTFKLIWSDSTWTPSWNLSFGSTYVRPMLAPSGRRMLLFMEVNGFKDPNLGFRQWVVTVEDFGDSVSAPDTVASTRSGLFSYGGAYSGKRRWVAFGDQTGLRCLYSDTLHVWREVDVPGTGGDGVAVAAIDDTTAIIAWGEHSDFIRWGHLRGTQFEEGSPPPGADGISVAPVFRVRPSGGHWMIWATKQNHTSIATLIGSTWTDRESLQCNYNPPGPHYTDAIPEISDDRAEFPVVSWKASRADYSYVFCVSCCTDSVFERAEPIGTPEDAFPPTLARDRNGDLWVAWYTENIQGMYWFHTYVRATASPPSFTAGAVPQVRWSLTEPAPKSAWTLLRAEEGGSFAAVASIKADTATQYSYDDTSAPPGRLLRYKLRRESVDTRYLWESAESEYWPPLPAYAATLSGPNPASDRLEFRISGAPRGPLAVRMYDLQGRVVWKPSAQASGTGDDLVSFEFSTAPQTVRSGLYFVRVADANGQTSQPMKLVVVR